MELDVSRIRTIPVQDFSQKNVKQQKIVQQRTERKHREAIQDITKDMQKLRDQIDAEKYFHEILDIPTFSKKIRFEVDESQVFVKVIDAETDKVIKEIPQKEMRSMYKRIRQYVGLFIDEQI
jgi:uncharacterized FlaG/YvyC family protein